jgi:hypothetical protein
MNHLGDYAYMGVNIKEGVDGLQLAEDKIRCWALVYIVMNL